MKDREDADEIAASHGAKAGLDCMRGRSAGRSCSMVVAGRLRSWAKRSPRVGEFCEPTLADDRTVGEDGAPGDCGGRAAGLSPTAPKGAASGRGERSLVGAGVGARPGAEAPFSARCDSAG